jgi:CheY-like chemotaxis protein
MAKPLRILIADNEELAVLRQESLKATAKRDVTPAAAETPATIIEAATTAELKRYLSQNESLPDYIDLAIVDIHMDHEKIEPRTYRITSGYHKIGRETPIIFVTGNFKQEILGRDGVPMETGLLLPNYTIRSPI